MTRQRHSRQCNEQLVRKLLNLYILHELTLFCRCRDAIMALHNASIKTAESAQCRAEVTRAVSRFVRVGGAEVSLAAS